MKFWDKNDPVDADDESHGGYTVERGLVSWENALSADPQGLSGLQFGPELSTMSI